MAGAFHRCAEPTTIGPAGMNALLAVPQSAVGLVIFAHSGSKGRLSPPSNHVADGLHQRGLATLLLNLLTPEEEAERSNLFDIALLASRLFLAVEWASIPAKGQCLPIGYFGTGAGAGAAVLAASGPDRRVRAIASCGARIDLAGAWALSKLCAPTQLIVGSLDLPVVGANQSAMQQMRCKKEMVMVSGASHSFEEPGALDQVICHVCRWFLRHLPMSKNQ